jgi:MFS family permease
MTQAAELPLPSAPGRDHRVIASVSAAHFVSHYYIVILAPLLAFVREDYGVSYTEVGLAFATFSGVSAVLQTPAGFLVDRFGARIMLIGGLLLGAAAFAAAGLVHSFWVFVAMFGVAGIANTVYHPADYAVLSQQVAPQRASQAFSIHTFAGLLGAAVAPASLLFLQSQFGWRGAFIAAAGLGVAVAVLLIAHTEVGNDHAPPLRPGKADDGAAVPAAASWEVLLSPPIVLNLFFFIMLSLMGGGLTNYSVVALGALHDTSPAVANVALSGLLLLSALGVLAGGMVFGRSGRHNLIAGGGLVGTLLATTLVAMADPGSAGVVLVMSFAGFCIGAIMPSRDMIVRAVTPPGAFGRVFGFVTTGFNIAGMISPIIFGQLMDHGHPRWVFLMVGICALISIATLIFGSRRGA